MSYCFKLFKIHILSKKLDMILKYTSQKVGTIKRKYALKIFIRNINMNFVKIRKLNKNFLLKKHFLTFFKKTCENMLNREKRKKKFEDIIEYYNYKLKNKFFERMKNAINILQEENGKMIRIKLIKKILYKNIKEIYHYKLKKYSFYRKLHLKKHFIKKWKFMMFMKKNYHIAKLKFISKFILNWRKALLIVKEEKLNAVIKICSFFDQLFNRIVIFFSIFIIYIFRALFSKNLLLFDSKTLMNNMQKISRKDKRLIHSLEKGKFLLRKLDCKC